MKSFCRYDKKMNTSRWPTAEKEYLKVPIFFRQKGELLEMVVKKSNRISIEGGSGGWKTKISFGRIVVN